MAKIRALLAILTITCGLLLGSIAVSAAEISKPGLSAGDTSVRAGQEMEFVFSLDGYDDIQTGINTIKGTFEYDSDIFEDPAQEDFEPLNSWESVRYNPSNRQFVLIRRANDAEGGEVVRIRLTAKENLPAGDVYVGVSELSASEGKGDIFPDDVRVKLSAVAQQLPAGSVPDAQEGQPSLETIPDAGEQGAAEIIQEAEEHTQPEDLAQEQIEQPLLPNQPGLTQPESASGIAVFYFCAFAALLTVACLVVVRWKKGRAKGVKLTTIVLLLAAVVTVTAGSVYAFAGKGDLNRDGAVDYNDVHRLQRHLIALQALPDGTWDAADMNFDGRLTVTDLSLLVQKIEQTLDYDVNITPAMDKFYYEKQEDVLLKFSAAVSYGAQIECVTVNGREYAVQKTQDGEYTVELQAADTPGLQIFHLTKVRLSNDRDVKVNVTETIDVLKAAPSVEDFLAEEWTETAQMKVSFHLNDEDAALISSALEVLKNTDGEFTMVDTMEISAGDNAFVLDLEEDMAYTLHISAQYNRDSDALPAEEDHRGSLAVMKEIQLNIDYQFSFGGLRTQTQGGFVTDKFHKNQRIDLWFESGNATRFLPERAVVNGVSYPVERSQDGYLVALDGFAQTGPAEIKVEQIVLENGKAFPVQTENAIAVMIRKELPAVVDLAAVEDAQNGQLDVSFRLTDPDGALSNRKIRILNAQGQTVGERTWDESELQQDTFRGTVALADTGLTTSYTVQIIADCDLSLDQSEAEVQKVLAEKEISAQPRAWILSGSAGEHYVEKGGQIELYFEIADNVEAPLSKLVVHHTELAAEPWQEGVWKVTLPAPEESGEQKLTLSQLVFADGVRVDISHDVLVEVMKSAPEVQGYAAEDILEKDQVKFQFVLSDADGAFLSGKIQLISNDGAAVVAQEAIIQPGRQEFTLDVEEQKEYTFRVLATWKQTEDGSRQSVDDVLLEKTVYMVRDYGLRLSEISTSSPEGVNTVYFEPGSRVKIRFRAQTNTSLAVERAQINGKLFDLAPLAGDVYELTATIGSQPGVRTVTIEKLVMENGKELPLQSGNSVRVEVLKAAPQIERFAWEKTAQDELRVQLVVKDEDGALESAQVQISLDDGTPLVTKPVFAGENEVTVALTQQERYVVSVTASFDRDTNALDQNSNFYQDQKIYTTVIAVSRDAIQWKDVTGAGLYHSEAGGVREIPVLDITNGLPTDVENYFVVLEMEGMPDFYAGIREFRRTAESGRVVAVVDQEDVAFYDEEGVRQTEYAIPLAYRDAQGEHPLIQSAQQLFEQMAAAPNGSYELTQDLDASGISADAAAVAGIFSGELDGNGYTIWNLPTSLFQTLRGANIHDLVIQNAAITTSRSGILANAIENQSVVENVFIVDSSISNGVDELGAFAGNLKNSTIRKSASVNVSVKGLVAVGGMVGKTNAGAVIDNCYVTGKVQGTYDHPTLGARVGGIAGWHGGGEIKNSFTQVQVIAPAMKGNGGLIGGPNTGSPVIENCLSMSDGAGYRIAGFDVLDHAKNVYEYSGSTSETNITKANQSRVKETDAIFDKSFYTDMLGWDETVWELELLAYGKRPNLQSAPEIDNNYGIPAYDLVLRQEGYRPEREQAYANMAKLMPFSDIRTWVEFGNRLAATDPLALQPVQYVLPLDDTGSLVTGVTRDTLDTIQTIRIVFEKEKMMECSVSWQKTMGKVVAAYRVEGMEAMYQFHHYIADLDQALLEETVNLLDSYDYAADIASLTREEESRLYTDYYQHRVKPGLKALAVKLLSSQAEYPTYCGNEAVRRLTVERIRDTSAWKKLLYGYNYYDKWYRMDYSGVNFSDLLFFNGRLMANGLDAATLSDLLLAAPEQQRETHQTVAFYNSVLKTYTGEELADFLGGLSYRIAGYDDPSDWFADNFDGILKEQPANGGAEGIRYRIWDILSGLEDRRKSILLPILTAPQEDMYLISLPSQLMLGSMNRYPTYLVKDGNERQRMQEIIDVYAEKMGIFYGVSSTWMDGSASLLNSFVNIQYDSRLNFPQSEAADAGDQDKDKTRDPVMKWVYEANNTISAKNGSAASADGTNVYWMQDAALGTSDYIFFTFSHETAHNQDGRYFYGGAGRREGTGGEAHADGNIAQEMRDGCMVFNISKINDIGVEMTNNFSYERIDSAEKIESYYREMFETGYVLDYLAAQAFLALTPEQQAAVAVQATHTAGGNASFYTEYRDVSVEEIRQMNLQDIEDLWENRLSIRNMKKGASEKINTATDGSYGFESFYCMNWYQSHNDGGSPDTHSFKRLGMEMLGVGGYENGYRIYMSALSKNDLDALRQITGQSGITWKEYKLNRFQTVKENLGRVPYFDAEDVIEQFKAAFERDAQNGTRSESVAVKRMLYGLVKRVTGDFSDGGIYQSPQVISVTSAQELIRLAGENPYGFYRLDADIDFTAIAAPQGSYIPNRFIGFLDGNGHKMTGMQYPLFGDLQYAQVSNLTIERPAYDAGAQAMLALKTRQVIVESVSVEQPDRPLPLVKTKTEGYYEYTK